MRNKSILRLLFIAIICCILSACSSNSDNMHDVGEKLPVVNAEDGNNIDGYTSTENINNDTIAETSDKAGNIGTADMTPEASGSESYRADASANIFSETDSSEDKDLVADSVASNSSETASSADSSATEPATSADKASENDSLEDSASEPAASENTASDSAPSEDNVTESDTPENGNSVPDNPEQSISETDSLADNTSEADTFENNESAFSHGESEQQANIIPEKAVEIFSGEGDDKYLSVIESQKKGYVLPIINIYTENGSDIVSRSQYINCEVFTGNVDDEIMLYNASARIRTRGNSTDYYGDEEKARTEQVPYRIKFNKKQSLLGLNDGAKCRNWVLLKCDYNVIGDEIAFRIGRSIFRNNNYVSDGRLALVFVNGVCKGCYCVCEQTQVNPNRVNVYECPENYTGTDIGYLVELDNYWESPYFVMDYDKETVTDLLGNTTVFNNAAYSIKNDIYSTDQKKYIESYIKAVYSVLVKAFYHNEYYVLNSSFKLKEANPKKLAKEYNLEQMSMAEIVADKVLDLDAAVDMYILHDIARSYDVGEGSFYMCVDFSADSTVTKLRFTAPWDFNWAYFEKPDKVGCFAGTIWDERITKISGIRYNPWFIILMSQDWFRQRVADRLSELVNNGVFESVYKQEEAMLKKYSADIRNAPGIYLESGLNQIADIKKRVDWMYQEYCVNEYKNLIGDSEAVEKVEKK